MGSIRMMNFSALDLNLLRVFDAMMGELSTTRAGERIGLSQPAVSTALARLRRVTGDELFVRDGKKMAPTALALSMREPVRAALAQLEGVFSEVAVFEPASSHRTFTLLGSDYFSTILMPELVKAVHPQAPNVTLRMLDAQANAVADRLSEGAADLAINRELDMPGWIASKTLFQGALLCVAARGNPMLARHGIKPGDRIPADVFCSIPQVLLSVDGSTTGTQDATLKQNGLTRQIVLTVPHFHAVALAVSTSGLLASLPAVFARYVARYVDIELYLPPFDAPKLDIKLYWHRRMDREQANVWLRDHVTKLLDFDGRLSETKAAVPGGGASRKRAGTKSPPR
jgi:DNA-binding transcriptional LysR family regulator